jgi:hypothetical protein
MNKVLESTRVVIERAKEVRINKEKIAGFCKDFRESHINHWMASAPFNMQTLGEKEKLHFLLVFNSISFSYWGTPNWTVECNGKKFNGSFGMIAALGKAVEQGIPILDMKYLSKISEEDLEKILQANTKIPLFEERLAFLREIGTTVSKNFGGDFNNLLAQADGDALKLLDLIVSNFSIFEDSSEYQGKKIFFLKRAQLLVADIFLAFKGKGIGNFKNIGEMTACADYKLPMVLRKLGILSYSKALSEKIDKRAEIPHGSSEEIEIRASTIWASELIKQKLKEKIPNLDSIHVNDRIWLLGQDKSFAEKPYHLTRTTAY